MHSSNTLNSLLIESFCAYGNRDEIVVPGPIIAIVPEEIVMSFDYETFYRATTKPPARNLLRAACGATSMFSSD